MTTSVFRLALAFCLLPVAANAATGDCFGWSHLTPATKISLVTVKTGARVHFVKGTSDQKGCPAAGAASCQRKDYLIGGNQVLVIASDGDFSCGEYVNAKGLVRDGWLPTAFLIPTPVAKPKSIVGDWSGGPEQGITIKPGKQLGTIDLDGSATFGALNPKRRESGNFNTGEFEATLKPEGDTLGFTDEGESKTLAYDKGDQDACRIRMRRLGKFLLVEDNHNCGGINVSFTGDYQRK